MSSELKVVRKSQGITLKKLAAKTGIALSTLGNFETGRYPLSQEFLERVAKELHVDVSEISSRDNQVQDFPGSSQSQCRYPASCDLPERLAVMEGDIKTIKTQMDTLVALLGESLRGGIEGKKKAG